MTQLFENKAQQGVFVRKVVFMRWHWWSKTCLLTADLCTTGLLMLLGMAVWHMADMDETYACSPPSNTSLLLSNKCHMGWYGALLRNAQRTPQVEPIQSFPCCPKMRLRTKVAVLSQHVCVIVYPPFMMMPWQDFTSMFNFWPRLWQHVYVTMFTYFIAVLGQHS